MWLVDAAKAAKQNVQEKASTFVATVQDEAKQVLQAMEYPVVGPVDEVCVWSSSKKTKTLIHFL